LYACGVPCFGLIQDDRFYFNYHHTAADTLAKVVPRELQENAAVMAVLAYSLRESVKGPGETSAEAGAGVLTGRSGSIGEWTPVCNSALQNIRFNRIF